MVICPTHCHLHLRELRTRPSLFARDNFPSLLPISLHSAFLAQPLHVHLRLPRLLPPTHPHHTSHHTTVICTPSLLLQPESHVSRPRPPPLTTTFFPFPLPLYLFPRTEHPSRFGPAVHGIPQLHHPAAIAIAVFTFTIHHQEQRQPQQLSQEPQPQPQPQPQPPQQQNPPRRSRRSPPSARKLREPQEEGDR